MFSLSSVEFSFPLLKFKPLIIKNKNMSDLEILQLIQGTKFLNPNDKHFLSQSLSALSPLEKIRLKSALTSNNPLAILQNLQMVKAKIYNNPNQPSLNANTTAGSWSNNQSQSPEKNKKKNLLEKLSAKLFPEKKPEIISPSILTDLRYLGSNTPKIIRGNSTPLKRLDEFSHPSQLSYLSVSHVNFGLSSNNKQILNVFFERTEDVFDEIESVDLKRGYFMNYIQSSLFNNYLKTALTALKHQELQPRKVVLNMMHQINSNNLNTTQFESAAEITNHLRSLVGI